MKNFPDQKCFPFDRFEVECVIGRDIKQSDFGGIVRVLSNWCDTCDTMLSCIETQADISAVFITRDVPETMHCRAGYPALFLTRNISGVRP